MKVGILTFHMAHNCGAMLQAYALCQSMTAVFSCDCLIIDYRLPEIYNKYKAMLQTNHVEPRRLKFDQYMKTALPLTEQVISLSEVRPFDLYIIGSDQIWNPKITQGYKDAYFAKEFPSNSCCVSYAASTGTRIHDVREFAKRLERFKNVSVRESWLQNALAPFLPRGVTWCLDPVLLLGKKQWIAILKRPKRKHYILLFSFHMDENKYRSIEVTAEQQGLAIIELITHERGRRQRIVYEDDYGPEEWLGYIKNASYIYTDSYHCALFAILFDIKLCVLTHVHNENERISDILYRLKLTRDADGFFVATKQTSQCLAAGKQISFNYLESVLKQAEYDKTEV